MWFLSSGLFLGWSLGANDAANVYGTAVSSNVIRWRTAAILTAIFVVIGALLEGDAGMHTLGKLADINTKQAFLCMLAAAITVTGMTFLKLPVSTSQSVVGAILAIGLMGKGVNWSIMVKIVICWVGTPIGAAIISFLIYHLIAAFMGWLQPSFFQFDRIVRVCLILFGAYSAYALGANNVANVTSVFVRAGIVNVFEGCLYGSLSIALGVLTFSKNVMRTVGTSVVPIDGFSALVSVLASAVTVHLYAVVGVPVSSSQAIVGAVVGIAFVKGLELVNTKMLSNIAIGWVSTPVISGGLTFLLIKLATLF